MLGGAKSSMQPKSWVGHMNRPTTLLAVYVFFCRSGSSILQSSQESLTFPPCWLQTPTKLLPTLPNSCLVFTDMTYACKLKLSGGIQIMRKYTNNDVYVCFTDVCACETKWVKNGDGGVNRQFREWTYTIAPKNKWKDLHPQAIIEF